LEKAEIALWDVQTGEQHDRLAGHRDAGALEQHQQEDADHPDRVDEVGRRVDDRVEDRVGDRRARKRVEEADRDHAGRTRYPPGGRVPP